MSGPERVTEIEPNQRLKETKLPDTETRTWPTTFTSKSDTIHILSEMETNITQCVVPESILTPRKVIGNS